MSKHSEPSHRRRRWYRVGVALGSLTLALLAAEVGLRLLYPIHPEGWFVRSDDPDLYYEPAPDLTYELAGDRFTHNNLGMRDDHDRDHASSGRPRVAFVGDSVCYGYFAGGRSLVSVAEERLDGNVECLNFGVPGYNTHQALAALRTRAGRFEDLRAAVYVFHENDLINATFASAVVTRPFRHQRYNRPASPLRSLAERSAVWWFLRGVGGDETEEGAGRAWSPPTERGILFAQLQRLMVDDSEHRRMFAGLLVEMQTWCRERAVELALLYVPSEPTVYLDPDGEYPAALRAVCEEAGVPFIDGLRLLAPHRERRLYGDVGHPNAAVHRLLGEAAGDWIARALR